MDNQMHTKLNIAVLGCGRMGEVHSEAYVTMPDEVCVFYVDSDREQAKHYVERFSGAGMFDSIDEALASPDIDAIDNCLPDHLHVAVTEASLRAGKHVLIEKPMAHTLEGANRMIQASRVSGKMLMLEENFRFLPHLNRAKEMIAEGVLGEIFLIEVHHFESLCPTPGSWRTQTTTQDRIGGMLIDVGHHFVDMAVQLGGMVEWVFAQFSQKTLLNAGGEDTAVLMLGYESGVIGQITLSIGAPGAPSKPTFIVCGTKASLYFDWQSGVWTGQGRAFEPVSLVMGKEPEPPDSFEYWGTAIHDCVRGFVRNIRADQPPQVPGEVGLHDLAIILAAHQSARTREVVSVRQAEAYGRV